MFSHLKISAILVGLFAHVITSLVTFFISAFIVRLIEQSDNKPIFAIIFLLILITMRTIGLLAIGYLTARIAKTQPLLHAFVCGCFAATFEILLGNSPFLPIFIYIPGLVAGAWLYRKRTSKFN